MGCKGIVAVRRNREWTRYSVRSTRSTKYVWRKNIHILVNLDYHVAANTPTSTTARLTRSHLAQPLDRGSMSWCWARTLAIAEAAQAASSTGGTIHSPWRSTLDSWPEESVKPAASPTPKSHARPMKRLPRSVEAPGFRRVGRA